MEYTWGLTWTSKVCKIMAFMATIKGLGLFFYILFGALRTSYMSCSLNFLREVYMGDYIEA